MSGPVPLHGVRYPALDGLRGLAALTVAVSHFTNETGFAGGLPGTGAGQLGVMLFFALSGFLMGRLYLPQALDGPALRRFAVRRFARVVPLYLLVVGASFALVSATGRSWPLYPVTGRNLMEHLLFWRGQDGVWKVPGGAQFLSPVPLIWRFWRQSRPALLPDVPQLARFLPFFLAGVVVSLVRERPPAASLDIWFASAMVLFVLSFPQIRKLSGLGAGNLMSGSDVEAVW